MATFFAVCNVNGPISVEINASDLDQAVAEFEAMDARELIDDARTDAEDEQVAVIDQVREKAAELVKQTWVKNGMSFEFKTDSESGKLQADSYEDACEKLRDMVGDDHEATGAWGWVEDQDGNRLVIGEVP